MNLKRGDVVVAKLNPSQGQEIGKLRPVVVLTQTRLIEAGLPVLFIVPLSTQYRSELSALRVDIAPRDNLLKTSYVVLEQARAIDAGRIDAQVLTRLSQHELQQIESKLCLMLGVSP
ncbi:MAG: type II toxin-antitoxin system PemK/MazF family toxin [Hydrogenovibrio sp.]